MILRIAISGVRPLPGRMFLIRGYQEDGAETFPAGTILDTTLPLWRMGEVLLHAEKLASLLRKDADTAVTVHFRAMFWACAVACCALG